MVEKKIKVYNLILEKIKKSKNIALISHKNPDIDTLSSRISFYEMINLNFNQKEIDLICVAQIPIKYNFLINTDKFKSNFNPSKYDLIIFFDSGSKTQTGFDLKYETLFDKKTFNTISIDHHITNEIYAKQNILNTTYSSTTMIIYEIFLLTNLKINKNIATSLLAGIYTDTGGFKHSNTTNITYFMAGKLLKLGADYNLIVDKFFKNNSLSTIKLWGKVISESFIDEENILYSYVNKSMIDSYNSSYEDVSGVVDHLNTTSGIKYCSLFTQKGEFVKASLRTLRDDIDLTLIAKKYNGGGHKKASGFTTKGQALLSSNFKIID
ncbi:bifunctional oligoribonuclease/PAP phosphatase NrnA [Candidatus Gracilibacteria bacterium]|nr:bifunctional oligoribonuclease/PAP phosphatase NrnA [Candidatus Gracilibacteria bacterium]